jgi:hypothetical protein
LDASHAIAICNRGCIDKKFIILDGFKSFSRCLRAADVWGNSAALDAAVLAESFAVDCEAFALAALAEV